MRIGEEYIIDFHKHNWKEILNDLNETKEKFKENDSINNKKDYKNFNKLFKKKYGSHLDYESYCRLITGMNQIGL